MTNQDISVKVVMAKDPEKRSGLRGLKGLVFQTFQESYAKTKDLGKLPSQDEMTKIVQEKFPQSMWIVKPKIHYSYYKSKFLTSIGVVRKWVVETPKSK